MIETIIAEDSSFITEGKAMLIEEFGKDYGNYFSILALIARGKTTRSEIEASIGKEVSGYLTKLEDEFSLIAKRQPLFEKTTKKNDGLADGGIVRVKTKSTSSPKTRSNAAPFLSRLSARLLVMTNRRSRPSSTPFSRQPGNSRTTN